MKSADLWQLRTLALEFARTDYVTDHDNSSTGDELPDYLDRLLVVAKMAEQAMEAQSCHGEGGAECKHDALLAEVTALSQPQQILACTFCVLEAKQAAIRKLPEPEKHPAAIIANGMGMCDVRHCIQPPEAQASSLLIAQPGQIPPGMLN